MRHRYATLDDLSDADRFKSTAVRKTFVYFAANGASDRWWKCIAYLPICCCLASIELPAIRKSLETGHHPNGELRHAHKISRRWFVRNSQPIYAERGPCTTRSGWSQVR